MIRMLKTALAWALLSTSVLAQSTTPGSGPYTSLYVTGATVGNGADLSEDVLQTYTLPASTLANVGDKLIIYATGNAIGSTDNKNARLRIAAGAPGILAASTLSTASATRWAQYAEIVKTGANAQTAAVMGRVANANTSDGLGLVTTTVTDTAAITLQITGQNATNSVLNSVTCGYFSVTLVRAPTS